MRQLVFFLSLLITLSLPSYGQNLEASGKIQAEGVGYSSNMAEGLLRADYALDFSAGPFQLIAKPQLEVSSFGAEGVMNSLWEQDHRWILNLDVGFVSVSAGPAQLRVGKQKFSSSLIEGPRRPAEWSPVDLLDPLEWERMAVPSVRLDLWDDYLTAWYAPGNTPSRMPEKPWRSETPIAITGQTHRLSGHSFGLRTQFYLGSVLLGAGLQQAPDFAPRASIRPTGPTTGRIIHRHNKVQQAFVQASFPVGSFLLQAESAYVHELGVNLEEYLSYVLVVNRVWQIGYLGDKLSAELQYIGEVGPTLEPTEKILDFRRNLQETLLSRVTYTRGRFSYRLEGAATVARAGGCILRPSVSFNPGSFRIFLEAGLLGGSDDVFLGRFGDNDFLRLSWSFSF